MYSFFATRKINDVNPYEWLHDVFKRLPEHKANKLHDYCHKTGKIIALKSVKKMAF
ncbi:hypothetical protein KAOT1_02321 [Kordia algicida OT-1]|uniref:Transposase IS66 C-terminal domain-containing protein n=2 Tax=Kordia TaxID=221065 RepID=A9EDY0_9FLAO|nr:hypothetical protein KAOT1_02321 [Kordia algicida OT-1]